MMALQLQHTHPRWLFWIKWTAASFVGAIAYLLVIGPIMNVIALLAPSAGASVGNPPRWLGLIVSLLGATTFGAAIGLAQWLVLRRVLRGTGWWVLATMSGYAVLLAGSYIIPLPEPGWTIGLLMFLLAGIAFGVAQWLVLRGRVEHAGWWILISIAGWALAFGLTGLALMSGLYVEPFDILAAFLVPVAVSGVGLVWLLQNTRQVRDE